MTPDEALGVLGLEKSFSEKDLKAAYRRMAKEAHPDVNPDPTGDPSGAAWRMIAVNQAYHRLRSEARRTAEDPKPGGPGNDYALYKRGVDLFQKIHPSEWIAVGQKGLFDPSAVELKSSRSGAFALALDRIGEAYGIFANLVHDHPGSPWVPDALDKLKDLDRMVILYRKMVQNGTDSAEI